MSEPEVIAVGTTCPICGETFYAPEPKYSELIQQLVRVARAAEKVYDEWYGCSAGYEVHKTIPELEDALSALPPHLRDG